MRNLVVVALLPLLGGCSLDEGGLATAPSDAAVLPDGGPLDSEVADLGVPDVPANCKDTGPCTQGIPSGWTLGSVPSNAADSCPNGFATKDYLAQVTAQAGACECGCTVTKDPVCDQGTVTFNYGPDSSCSNVGVAVAFPGCKSVGVPFNVNAFEKMARLPPTGGTCTGDVVEDKTKTQRVLRRACDAPAKCAEDYCSGALIPAGSDVCIHKDGEEPTCPVGFDTRRAVVGGDFSLGCSACTCDVNGTSTCAASMKLYNDANCATEKASFAVDGNCGAVTGAGNLVSYAKYVGTLTKACTGAGAKAATPTFTQKTTICCK